MRYNILGNTLFVCLLWLIKTMEIYFNISFSYFGVYPLKISGLIGIIFAPLIHGDIDHLLANTFPVFVLGIVIAQLFTKHRIIIFLLLYFIPNIFVWIIARPAFHIGASTLIYAFASFIFFTGLFERKRNYLALSLMIVFLYGGLIWGVLPIKEGVSFEAHLSGAFTGAIVAYLLRGKHEIVHKEKIDLSTMYSTTFGHIEFKYRYKKRGH